MRNEIEDGMGCAGLVPSAAEKAQEAQEKLRDEDFLRNACAIVECHCRSLGRDCQVIFSNEGVEIAPLSDPGSTTGKNLYEALMEAEKWKSIFCNAAPTLYAQ